MSAEYTTKFWHKVIYNIVGNNYKQTKEIDNEWGYKSGNKVKLRVYIDGCLSICSGSHFSGESSIICNKSISFGRNFLILW